jgi:hypothetical protein
MWVLLIPVIAVEAVYARRRLQLRWRPACVLAGAANLASTLIGVPIAWGAMYVLEMVLAIPLGLSGWELPPAVAHFLFPTLGAAWLGGERMPAWYVPVAAAALCVPCFFASVRVETKVAHVLLPESVDEHAAAWAWGANRLTYGPIIGALLVVALFVAIFPSSSGRP